MMRRRHVLAVLAGAAVVCGGGPLLAAHAANFGVPPTAGRTAVARTGGWGRAIEVPGLAGAQIQAVSCGGAGNCGAGGWYDDSHDHMRGFVVTEQNGHWNPAIEVPGLGALDTDTTAGQGAQTLSVSCASAGNCVADGIYDGAPNFPDNYGKGYVVTERNGVWGLAITVPGLRALHAIRYSGVASVSCASTGNCAAGGWYSDTHGHRQGFVTIQRNGRWKPAIEIPSLGALNTGGSADVAAVSCARPAGCAAGGSYLDGHGRWQGYLT